MAYLATLYPGLSHSFVQREVHALRDRGLDIHTFALHDSQPEHVFTQADRDADDSTFTVLPPRWGSFLGAHLRAFATEPGRLCANARVRAAAPPGGFHGRWWQLFYFLEAVPIWRECSRRGLTHIHAHFTNPSGDVAQLVAQLGAERDGPGQWSWSFSAHGTDIFNDGPGSLAGKVETASLVVCISDFGRSQLMRMAPEDNWDKIRVARCGLNGDWLTDASRTARPTASCGCCRSDAWSARRATPSCSTRSLGCATAEPPFSSSWWATERSWSRFSDRRASWGSRIG